MTTSNNCGVFCGKFTTALRRKKVLPPDLHQSELHRCLGVFSLASLCTGSVIGAGIYALTGEVAKNYAGPSVILSFGLTGIVTLFAAMCYAEFTARIPQAGSGYLYAYYAIGELVGFITGWNMVIEYILTVPTIARSLSGYLDTLMNRSIETYMTTHAPINSPYQFASKFPDFMAFLICILLVILLSVGIKGSFVVNNVINVLNIMTIGLVITLGFVYGKMSTILSTPFFPYGLKGTLKASATCFTALTGFDVLSTSTEEAKNPTKTIPIVMLSSVAFTIVIYAMASFSLLLLVPYSDIDDNAAFVSAFEHVGVKWAKYVVAIGGMFAMLTSLFGALYAISRLCFAMATDGLLFSSIALVNPKTKTPIVSVVIVGIIGGIISIFFNKESLISMLSIGTLLTYTGVITSVVNLRYAHTGSSTDGVPPEEIPQKSIGGTLRQSCQCLSPYLGRFPPGVVCKLAIAVFHLGAIMMSLSVTILFDDEYSEKLPCYIFIPLAAVIMTTTTVLICCHRQNELQLSFTVPCVPLLPFTAVFVNYTFLATLSTKSWTGYSICLTVGLLIYFGYGMWHSKAAFAGDSQVALLEKQDQEANEIESESKKVDAIE